MSAEKKKTTPLGKSEGAEPERFIPDGMGMFQRNVKRIGDCALAFLALIVFSPLFLLCYIAVKREDGGPAIFKQERIGRFGRPFNIYKIRSMRLDAEKFGPALYKGGADPRMTRVGKFLRVHHLDELPQLWNILKGDMSFVGPRPLISSEMRAHRLRLEYGVYRFRPGLTGWAQINGRDSISLLRKMKLDKEYCDNWSLKLDLIILLRSVGAVVKQEGFHEGTYHRR